MEDDVLGFEPMGEAASAAPRAPGLDLSGKKRHRSSLQGPQILLR